MKIIKPTVKLLWITPNAEKAIERAGKICYKSENNITEDSHKQFISNIIKRNHEAVLEHASASFLIICDRGVSHELVRHRLASYCQESTRYCNYSKDKFNNELTFIEPCFFKSMDSSKEEENRQWAWAAAMAQSENYYKEMIELGATPEEARSVLPNSLKTEIVITANLREFRHVIKLRTSKAAHPQIKEVIDMVKNILIEQCSSIFEDLK